VACDGLKGLPDAIAEVWPLATVQNCGVHLVRASLRYASRAHWSRITKTIQGGVWDRSAPESSNAS
jgi:transposase-like protein